MTNLIDQMVDGIKASMFRPINKSASIILGITSIIWGFWVANPFWNVFDSAQVYHVLNWIAPEAVWGLVPIVIGATMVFAMLKNKFDVLLFAVRAGFYFWTFSAACFFVGDWQNTAGVIYTMVALYCGYVALNLSINRDYYLEK